MSEFSTLLVGLDVHKDSICALRWLKAPGLVSVKDLWCKAQGYTTAKG